VGRPPILPGEIRRVTYLLDEIFRTCGAAEPSVSNAASDDSHQAVVAGHSIGNVTTMRALVTGGAGFLGRRVVADLLRDGATVRCLIRPSSDVSGLKATVSAGDMDRLEFVRGDLTRSDTCVAAVRGLRYRVSHRRGNDGGDCGPVSLQRRRHPPLDRCRAAGARFAVRFGQLDCGLRRRVACQGRRLE